MLAGPLRFIPAGLALVAWIFVVAGMADTSGLYVGKTVDIGGGMKVKLNGAGLWHEDHDDCSIVKAGRAFGVMTAILLPFAVAFHVVDGAVAMGKLALALPPQASLAPLGLHGVAALFLIIYWPICISLYTQAPSCDAFGAMSAEDAGLTIGSCGILGMLAWLLELGALGLSIQPASAKTSVVAVGENV
eukprot:TRINITY_DN5495_c0_g1_i1.p1 TRINITY_DN5495_c0_g1~~TRINITY_DN5495_c0_g1_i1.p1  ORF type:complete len:189 (+),score=9.23 TRINITY_DN5495_c0_g1_i1:76-642(+)